MNLKQFIIVIFALFSISCSNNTENVLKIDNNFKGMNDLSYNNLLDSTSFSYSHMSKYFNTWKNIILERHGWTEKDFNRHIFIDDVGIKYQDIKQFRAYYYYCIDWAFIKTFDVFTIYMDSTHEISYKEQIIPKNQYLNKKWIDYIIDNRINHSRITKLYNNIKLKYNSYEDAVRAIEDSTHVKFFTSLKLIFKKSKDTPKYVDGIPFLIANGTIDRKKNECISGSLNLITGEHTIRNNPCSIRDFGPRIE